MEIEKKIWFTTPQGTIGIVLGENSVGEKLAYIGIGAGISEAEDAVRIADWGAKFPVELAEQL